MVWPGPTRLTTDFSGYLGPLPPGSVVDEWGHAHVPTSSVEGDHAHLEGYRHPMLNLESAADAADYPLPDLDADYRYEPVRAEIEEVHRRGLASMAMLECTIFERAWYLRSMERLLLDFTDGNAFATTLLDRITDRRIVHRARRLERYFTQPFFVVADHTGIPGASVTLETTMADCEAFVRGTKTTAPLPQR